MCKCNCGASAKCQSQTGSSYHTEDRYPCSGPAQYAKDEPKFKLGDRVYSPIFGWGHVSGDYTKDNKATEIWVRVENTIGEYVFKPDGRCLYGEGEVLLFHDKPQIIPPKKKIKKWFWAYQWGEISKTLLITQIPFSEEEWAYLSSGGDTRLIPNAVKLPWTEIEVEEEND